MSRLLPSGWWTCHQCSFKNNPALCGGRCTNCSHARCNQCLPMSRSGVPAKCQGCYHQGGGLAINVLLRTIPHFVVEDAQIVPMRDVTSACPCPGLVCQQNVKAATIRVVDLPSMFF